MFRLSFFEVCAPCEVARFGAWEAVARDFPAAEVLGAHGDLQEGGGGGGVLVEIGCAFLGVVEFVGGGCAVNGDNVGVGAVGGVDGA